MLDQINSEINALLFFGIIYYGLVPYSKNVSMDFISKISDRDYDRVNRQEFAKPFLDCSILCTKHKNIFKTPCSSCQK